MGTLKDPQRLEELLNFRLKLLFQLGGAPAVRVCEGEFGIARQHWRLLAALVEKGPLTVGALKDISFIDAARVSRALAVLRKMGLVESCSPPSGRTRHDALAATAAGRTMYQELFPRLASINRRLCEILSQQEADQLDAMLARLTGHAALVQQQMEHTGAAKAQRRLGGSHRIWDKAGASRLASRAAGR